MHTKKRGKLAPKMSLKKKKKQIKTYIHGLLKIHLENYTLLLRSSLINFGLVIRASEVMIQLVQLVLLAKDPTFKRVHQWFEEGYLNPIGGFSIIGNDFSGLKRASLLVEAKDFLFLLG